MMKRGGATLQLLSSDCSRDRLVYRMTGTHQGEERREMLQNKATGKKQNSDRTKTSLELALDVLRTQERIIRPPPFQIHILLVHGVNPRSIQTFTPAQSPVPKRFDIVTIRYHFSSLGFVIGALSSPPNRHSPSCSQAPQQSRKPF